MVRQAGGRYVGYTAGVADEDPRSDYTHPGYYAVGGSVDHPTVEGVVQEMSATRR